MDKEWRPFLAELLGTFALVFVVSGTVCMTRLTDRTDPMQPLVVGIALAHGLILTAVLSATVNISGGLLNPALTLTLWVFKRHEARRACGLVGGQLVGAFLAGLCLRFLFADDLLTQARLGTPHLNPNSFGLAAPRFPYWRTLASGISIEFVLTFILTFAIYGTLLDPRAPQRGVLGPGWAVVAVTFLGYPLTGAALNPARWLGPVLWERTLRPDAFNDHLVFWVGPIFGALAAAGICEYLLWPEVAGHQESADVAGDPVPTTQTRPTK